MSTLDRAHADKITRLYSESAYMTDLGVVLTEMLPGEIATTLEVQARHGQQDGFVHAAVTTALADHGAGCAAATLAPLATRVLTQTFTMHLVRPAVGPRLRSRSVVLRLGKTSAVVESEVFSGSAAGERLVAKGTYTIAIVALAPAPTVTAPAAPDAAPEPSAVPTPPAAPASASPPASATPRGPITATEVPWQVWSQGTCFGSRYRHLTRAAVGDDYHVGVQLEELPPGKRSAPAHYHLLEEEHVYVLEGRATLRLGDARHALEAGDYVCFPAGQTTGHCLINDSDAVCRLIVVGERKRDEICVYPDSNKLLVRRLDRLFDAAAVRGYWDGEKTE